MFDLFTKEQHEETMQQAPSVVSVASEPPQIENNPNAIDVTMIQQVAGSSAPFFRTKMLATIDAVEEYSWTRGEQGGLDWGFENLNKAFEGLNTGVFLVAGQSNIGKSSFMVELAWRVAKYNRVVTKQKPRKAFVLYFSLDDSNNELLPRLIAVDQRIPINVVRFPKKYQDNAVYMEKRAEGLQALKDSVDYLNMMDVNEGSDIEFIEETIAKYHLELQKVDPTYQLVVFVDNFHDITIGDPKRANHTGNEKYDYLADACTKLATKYDIPFIATAEFRKINGNRRPTVNSFAA